MTNEHKQLIGELNGKWSILFRLALATYPFLITWCVWVTVQEFQDIAFRNAGGRFSETDGARLKAELIEKINAMPSQEWRDRIINIERDQREIARALVRIETKLERNP